MTFGVLCGGWPKPNHREMGSIFAYSMKKDTFTSSAVQGEMTHDSWR